MVQSLMNAEKITTVTMHACSVTWEQEAQSGHGMPFSFGFRRRISGGHGAVLCLCTSIVHQAQNAQRHRSAEFIPQQVATPSG